MCIAGVSPSATNAQSKTSLVMMQRLVNLKDTILQRPLDNEKLSLLNRKEDYLDFYHKSLGIFCRAENKILGASNIPFKMRLGNVQYVDKLEGK